MVGAGIGGLSAAALLACRGLKVLVTEAHHQCGGNCTSWRRQIPGLERPFVFDSGVQDISGLGPDGPLTDLLQQIGAPAAIRWKRVHHLYWSEGLHVAGGLSQDKFIENLCQAFPEQAEGIKKFFAEIHAVYRELYGDVEKTGGIPAAPQAAELRAWPAQHPHAARWMKQRFPEMLRTYVSDEVLEILLQTLSEYITDRPESLTVLDMAPLYGYYFEGGHYPSGGAQELPDLLCRTVRDHGGTILLRTRIEKILVEGGRAAGVRTAQGNEFRSSVVIANGDIVSTLTKLVGTAQLPTAYARRVAALHRGPSAVLVSLGLSAIMPLPPRIFIRKDALAFGIGNPSVLDPDLAPPGHSVLTLLLLLSEREAADWEGKTNSTYATRKEQVADMLVSAIETSVIPDIRSHIVCKEIATPATFASFTGAMNGNIYGAARGAWRPGMQSPIPGLLLVGGGTDTGAGIEAVVISSTRAANAVMAARSE